ncbi:hypothetical protein B9Z45_15055 [Limnohabitans sp. 2KL-17]|nr:hypothetical protein B9Z45_15055 [Limnohabitans sp. 2KL-17]
MGLQVGQGEQKTKGISECERKIKKIKTMRGEIALANGVFQQPANPMGDPSPAPVSPNNCTMSVTNESITVTCPNDGGGGGGKVICTELCRNGAIEHEVWMADIRYSRQNFSEQTMRGYHLWGIPYVKLMRKYPSFAKLAEYPTRWFAEDIAYRMGVLSKPNYKGLVLREVFFRPVCFGIGLFAKARDWQALWRDGVTPSGVRS